MMRKAKVALLVAIAGVRQCAFGHVAPVTMSDASAFAASVGVNTHLQYADTRYGDVRAVENALAYLGIGNVRDSGLRRGESGLESYVRLASRGLRYDLFLNAELPAQLNRVTALALKAPGAIATLEGPNEVNNDPVSFAGRSGEKGALAYQAALFSGIRTRHALAHVPVLSFTDWPPASGRADAVNVHSYPRRGEDPAVRLRHDIDLSAAALPPGLPVYITETGYPTGASGGGANVVAPQVQAARILATLLEGYRAGVRRSFIYELFDEGGEDRASDPEAHYGLFDRNGEAKPAAVALHVLMRQVADLDQIAARSPAPVGVRVEGAKSLLLQGRSGSSLLMIWGAPGSAAQARIALSRPSAVSQLDFAGSKSSAPVIRRAWTISVTDMPQALVLSPR